MRFVISLLLPVEELLRLDFVISVSAWTLRRTSLGPMVISIGNTCSGNALRDFWLLLWDPRDLRLTTDLSSARPERTEEWTDAAAEEAGRPRENER